MFFLCSKWTSYHVLHLKLQCDIAWRNLFSPNNSNDYTFSGSLECPLFTVLTIYYKNVEWYYEKYFYRDWQEILKKVQVFELHLYIQYTLYNFSLFSLSNKEVHVDSYGFRHKFEEQSLLLHYLCQELAQHYLSQAGTYEEHQRRWTHFMRQHGKSIANHVIIYILYLSYICILSVFQVHPGFLILLMPLNNNICINFKGFAENEIFVDFFISLF